MPEYYITCYNCHNIYWQIEKLLTVEQNDEFQLAVLNKKQLPLWFEPWWNRMKKIISFL